MLDYFTTKTLNQFITLGFFLLHLSLFSSNIIQDLKEECLDTPTEITENSRAQQLLTRAQKEKEEYEENNFIRLPVTKAEKHRQRKLTTLGM